MRWVCQAVTDCAEFLGGRGAGAGTGTGREELHSLCNTTLQHQHHPQLTRNTWDDLICCPFPLSVCVQIYADVCVLPPPDSNRGGGNGSLTRSSRTYRGALLGHVHPRKRVAGRAARGGKEGGDNNNITGIHPQTARFAAMRSSTTSVCCTAATLTVLADALLFHCRYCYVLEHDLPPPGTGTCCFRWHG